MATESFYEDMVIDTPEAAKNLEELANSGKRWKRGNSKYVEGDESFCRMLEAKYGKKSDYDG